MSLPNPEEDDRLAAREAEITQELPELFEAMNDASGKVNVLERKVNEVQEKYKHILEQWRGLYKDLRAQHGAAFDCAKPYFDTAEALELASVRVQRAARKLSKVSSREARAKAELRAIENRLGSGVREVSLDADQQEGLSRATEQLQCYQRKHGKCEQNHACALREYNEIKESLDAWHKQVGYYTIKRLQPYFKQLEHHKKAMASEQAQITALTKQIQAAKSAYSKSMSGLERINTAVHEVRQEHAKSLAAMLIFGEEECTPGDSAAKGGDGVGVYLRLPEETPELTPEVAPQPAQSAAANIELPFV